MRTFMFSNLLFRPRVLALSLLLASIPIAHAELPEACHTECATPYGMVLGETDDGVKAYSNCRPDCANPEPARLDGRYTGIKWQCVEFARRWLLVNTGAVYGDVDIAADIWDKIDHLTNVESGKTIKLEQYVNGSDRPPRVGDLLIYAKAFHGTGHVAIVTDADLDKGTIEVGEQNFRNISWNGDHSRSIELIKQGRQYWLLDAYLLGWKSVVE